MDPQTSPNHLHPHRYHAPVAHLTSHETLIAPLTPPPPYPTPSPSDEADDFMKIFSTYRSLLRIPGNHTYIELLFVLGGALAGSISVGLQFALPPMDSFRTNNASLFTSSLTFIYVPATFLMIHVFVKIIPGTMGSGIPSAMILLEKLERRTPSSDTSRLITRVLSTRILVGKFVLLMAGLAAGGSLGKEGPMVTLSASAMVLMLNFILLLPNAREQFSPNLNTYTRTAIIAGSGAGIAAAFNSITGGIMFAIEEFACNFSFTMGRCLALCVVSSMLAVFGLNTIINSDYENLTFYGTVTDFATTSELFYVSIIAGLCGGLLGGMNAQVLLWLLEIKAWTTRRFASATYIWCLFCSLSLAALHVSTGGITAGEGTDSVISILSEGAYCNDGDVEWHYFIAKILGTLLTYLAGICGGVFAPSLSAGAGFGQVIYCELFKDKMSADGSSQFAVLCSMTAFFGGFTQSPLTSFSILLGMVQISGAEYNTPITHVAMLTASVIGSLAAGVVNPTRLYHGMAKIIAEGIEKDLSLGEEKLLSCCGEDDDDDVLFDGDSRRSSTLGGGLSRSTSTWGGGAPQSSATRRSSWGTRRSSWYN